MRKALIRVAAVAVAALAVAAWVTRPVPLPDDALAELAALTGDPVAGESVFWAGGCASCHAAEGSEGEARLILSGGQAFPSDFGTFRAPNISMHPEAGIGAWTLAEFANATQRGVSPQGSHYYPAFPYAGYALATSQDMADLWAFWQTLPADGSASQPHDLAFPFSIRRSVGGWKFLYAGAGFTGVAETEAQIRGRYLSEALGHCAECHTPRDALGGLDRTRWLAGAPNPSGQGNIPNITPARLTWSESEIAQYLKDGFTPDFDSVGGHMVSVVANLSRLSDDDRGAIAAYLKAQAPIE
ncbi:c-type cytochrome [Jannaschia pohangensis]|uniref:Cytochrome c, mono-and diheme variants n=1 Tax=Jannaschia pohangensis TaxID=390807 RepID=A0A1I3GP09_9RHOB|nr:cytochrome c [Jannaschia pohangensis]SFI25248.1 Cytochrome c, mono-and diheme variants [Jannaschia pohangensis]